MDETVEAGVEEEAVVVLAGVVVSMAWPQAVVPGSMEMEEVEQVDLRAEEAVVSDDCYRWEQAEAVRFSLLLEEVGQGGLRSVSVKSARRISTDRYLEVVVEQLDHP